MVSQNYSFALLKLGASLVDVDKRGMTPLCVAFRARSASDKGPAAQDACSYMMNCGALVTSAVQVK